MATLRGLKSCHISLKGGKARAKNGGLISFEFRVVLNEPFFEELFYR